jgi:hypothetical protein
VDTFVNSPDQTAEISAMIAAASSSRAKRNTNPPEAPMTASGTKSGRQFTTARGYTCSRSAETVSDAI